MENLQFIEEQDKQVYFELFSDNKDGLTSISGSAAGKILARSGLNNAVLAVIWSLSNISSTGSLTLGEFCLAMHLTKTALSNINSLPSSLASNIQNCVRLCDEAIWLISPTEKAQHDALFTRSTNSGFLEGDRARNIFTQSTLDTNILAHIWNLSDIQGDGKLNSDEFAVAMHLIHYSLKGNPLPYVLPSELIPPSFRHFKNVESNPQLVNSSISKSSGRSSAFQSLLDSNNAIASKFSSVHNENTLNELIISKRKELGVLLPQLDALSRAIIDVDEMVEKEKDSIKHVNSTVSSLVSAINDHQERSTQSSCKHVLTSQYFQKGQELFNHLNNTINDCLELEQEYARKCVQIINIKASIKAPSQTQQFHSKNSNLINFLDAPGTDPVASKAAALLAQRMAALGVGKPVNSVRADDPVDYSTEISKIETSQNKKVNELNSILDNSANTLQYLRNISDNTVKRDSQKIPVDFKMWMPSLDDRLKYEDGLGFISMEVKSLLQSLKVPSNTPVRSKDRADVPQERKEAYQATHSRAQTISAVNSALAATNDSINAGKLRNKTALLGTSYNQIFPYTASSTSSVSSQQQPTPILQPIKQSYEFSAESNKSAQMEKSTFQSLENNPFTNVIISNPSPSPVHPNTFQQVERKPRRPAPPPPPVSRQKQKVSDAIDFDSNKSILQKELFVTYEKTALAQPKKVSETPRTHSAFDDKFVAPSRANLFTDIRKRRTSSDHSVDQIKSTTEIQPSTEEIPSEVRSITDTDGHSRVNLFADIRKRRTSSADHFVNQIKSVTELQPSTEEIPSSEVSSTSDTDSHSSTSPSLTAPSKASEAPPPPPIADDLCSRRDSYDTSSNEIVSVKSVIPPAPPPPPVSVSPLNEQHQLALFQGSKRGKQDVEKESGEVHLVRDIEESAVIVLYQMQTIYNFSSNRPDDLVLNERDLINVEKEDGDWAFGKNLSSMLSGWFPKNYAVLHNEDHQIPKLRDVEAESVFLFEAEVLFDYTAQRSDEISVSAGDFIKVVEKTDVDWWLVENDEKQSGVVPCSFLKVIGDAASDTGLLPTVFQTVNGNERALQETHKSDDASADTQSPVIDASSLQETSLYSSSFTSLTDTSSKGLVSRTKKSDLTLSTFHQPWHTLVDPDILDLLDATERKRQESIFELIGTEESYVRDLQVLIELFYRPLTTFLDKKELDFLFGNIEEILATNTKILYDFESVQIQGNYVVESIGSIFLRHIQSLEHYESYCGNLSSAIKHLQKRRLEDKKLDAFLKGAQKNPKSRSLDLTSFLLLPMQRITRYTLVLKQILYHTPIGHRDYNTLVQALELSEGTADLINTAAKKQDSRAKINEIINNTEIDLALQNSLLSDTKYLGYRQFIQEGTFTKAKSGRKLTGILFNDMILFLLKNKPGSHPAFTLYRQPIPFTDLRACSADDAGLELRYGNEVLCVKLSGAAERKKWETMLNAQADIYRAAAERTKKVSIHSASNLTPLPGGKGEIFCRLQLNEQIQTTGHVNINASNPVFGETKVFSVMSLDENLKIDVYNFDPLSKNHFLGTAIVELHILEYYGGKETEIISLNLSGVPSGILKIQLKYSM